MLEIKRHEFVLLAVPPINASAVLEFIATAVTMCCKRVLALTNVARASQTKGSYALRKAALDSTSGRIALQYSSVSAATPVGDPPNPP